MLVKNFLDAFAHLADGMFWAIEGEAVLKDETDIANELVGVGIAGIVWVGVWFGGI